MYQFLYIITTTLALLLSGLQLLMLIRAIMSWFPIDEESAFLRFVLYTTEPVIVPVRILLDRFGLFEGMPIDMAFFITFILLSMLRLFL